MLLQFMVVVEYDAAAIPAFTVIAIETWCSHVEIN